METSTGKHIPYGWETATGSGGRECVFVESAGRAGEVSEGGQPIAVGDRGLADEETEQWSGSKNGGGGDERRLNARTATGNGASQAGDTSGGGWSAGDGVAGPDAADLTRMQAHLLDVDTHRERVQGSDKDRAASGWLSQRVDHVSNCGREADTCDNESGRAAIGAGPEECEQHAERKPDLDPCPSRSAGRVSSTVENKGTDGTSGAEPDEGNGEDQAPERSLGLVKVQDAQRDAVMSADVGSRIAKTAGATVRTSGAASEESNRGVGNVRAGAGALNRIASRFDGDYGAHNVICSAGEERRAQRLRCGAQGRAIRTKLLDDFAEDDFRNDWVLSPEWRDFELSDQERRELRSLGLLKEETVPSGAEDTLISRGIGAAEGRSELALGGDCEARNEAGDIARQGGVVADGMYGDTALPHDWPGRSGATESVTSNVALLELFEEGSVIRKTQHLS